MARIREGDEIGAGFLNNHEEAWEWYRRFKARGEGGSRIPSPVNFSKVMAANYTSQQVYIGDVCEFDGNPFEDIDLTLQLPDPKNDRWVKAVTPDTTRIGWGIALDPMSNATGADREGARFLVLGICHANVVMEHEDHKYAERRNGERVLHSTAVKSAVKILDVHSGTDAIPEQRVCLVQIMDEPGDVVDIVQVVEGGSAGDVIILDPSIRRAFQGKFKRYDAGEESLTGEEYCWILFVDDYDNVAFDTAVVNYEYYGPAKYVGRDTFDFTELQTYVVRRGELVEMVQVYHSADTPPSAGDVVEGLSSGYHPGFVVRYSGSSTLDAYSPCWIQFTTPFNGLAIQSQYYGPAKYAGIFDLVEDEGMETETHDRRPVFILDHGEHAFPGRFDAAIADGASGTFSVYHPQTLTDSGIDLTVAVHGDPVIEGKGFAQFVAGRWFGANSECTTSEEEE